MKIIKIMKAVKLFSVLCIGAGIGGMLESGASSAFFTLICIAVVLYVTVNSSIKTAEEMLCEDC